jgi:addiction module RelE/StbE family toxin
MQLRWTSAAADDLENIANYLFERTPEHAPRLIREICDAPSALKSFPNRGRAGKKEGTRELVMPSLPYIIVYHVRGDAVIRRKRPYPLASAMMSPER